MQNIVDLKNILEEENFTVSLNQDEILEVLNITLEDKDGELIEDNYIRVIFIPQEDEDDAILYMQFTFDYPFSVNKLVLQTIYKELTQINRKLAFGQFNLSEDENKIYFKYIHSHDTANSINPKVISELVGICMFTIHEYGDQFYKLGNAQ